MLALAVRGEDLQVIVGDRRPGQVAEGLAQTLGVGRCELGVVHATGREVAQHLEQFLELGTRLRVLLLPGVARRQALSPELVGRYCCCFGEFGCCPAWG